jgi:7-keto-8-aminopelargonate synthetase-like enzyme
MVDQVGFVLGSRAQPHTFKFKTTPLQLAALIFTLTTLDMFNATICVSNRNMHFSRTKASKENVFYYSRDHPIVPAICSIAKT